MTRNQLSKNAKPFSGNPIFTVDSSGNILPTNTQTVVHGGTILIQAASSSTSPYAGYVCAWQSGQCKCATLVTNLFNEPHMTINSTAYTISSSASEGSNFTLYTTLSEIGSGPTANGTNGDIHIGS